MENKSLHINKGIKLESPKPLDDGLRNFNQIYWAMGGIFLVVGFFEEGFGAAIFWGVLGCIAALVIKQCIANWKMKKLRRYKFYLGNKNMTNDDLLKLLIVPLTQMGMVVEKNSNGSACVQDKGLIYDVIINEDDTFTLWWRRSVTSAFLSPRSDIHYYRKAVVSMGIIAYNIQTMASTFEK